MGLNSLLVFGNIDALLEENMEAEVFLAALPVVEFATCTISLVLLSSDIELSHNPGSVNSWFLGL